MDDLKEKLLTEVADLARADENNSDGFLKSLTNMLESEKYKDVAEELAASEDADIYDKKTQTYATKGYMTRKTHKSSMDDDLEDLYRSVRGGSKLKKVSESTHEEESFGIDINSGVEEEKPPDESPGYEQTPDFDTLPVSEAEVSPETEKITENAEALETSEITGDSETGDTSEDSETIEACEPAETTETVEAEETTEASETREDIETTEAGDTIETSETGEAKETTETDDTSDTSESAESSETPEASGQDSAQEESNSGEDKPAKPKKNKALYNIMMVACIGVFIYCVARIGVYYYTGWKYRQSMNKLTDVVGDIVHEVTPAVRVVNQTELYFPDEKIYASEKEEFQYVNEVSDSWRKKYASLVDLNPDCVGWLQIPDTEINYPVMYTPNDVEKYLYRNFEGQYLYRGLPFMSEGTLLNKSQNYIIYGHNMNDGTAFNNLRLFLDYNWASDEKHKYCYFNTAFKEGVYELMAVVITKVYNVDDDCFKYYKYSDELTEDEFNTYVYYMKRMSSYDTGVEAVWGDELLSLSTCYRVYDPEGRLVVVFRRVQ